MYLDEISSSSISSETCSGTEASGSSSPRNSAKGLKSEINTILILKHTSESSKANLLNFKFLLSDLVKEWQLLKSLRAIKKNIYFWARDSGIEYLMAGWCSSLQSYISACHLQL